MTIRKSSLERLGNFKVTFDDATDQILGLVDAHGQERQLVTAATGPGGVVTFEPNVATAIASLGGGAAISATSFAGVDATGATDCTDAFNAGLAALPIGSVVFCPPGTYMAAVRLTVPDTTLTGTWGATIKTPDGATAHVNDACVRILADGCTVENLSLNGNKTGNPAINDNVIGRQSDGVGIYANRATVRNCKIYDTIGHKIIVWNQEFAPTSTAKGARSHFTIEGNHIYGFSEALRASIDVASTDVTTEVNHDGIIRGNFIDGNMVIVHTAYDLLFEGNVIFSSTGQEGGLSVHTNSERVICRNNVIGPGAAGLQTSGGCSEIEFSGNKLYNINGNAIVLSGGTNLSAKDNLIHTTGASAAGVNVASVTNGAVCDNTIIAAGSRSIYTTTNCENLKIDGNLSINPESSHIEIAATTFATVENNKCVGGVTGVVSTAGTNAGLVVMNNDIKGTSGTGIHIVPAAAIITGNVVRNTGSHAIRIYGQGARVIGNEILDVTGSGIYVLAAVTGVVINDNRITSTTLAPINGLQADTVVRRNVGYTTEAIGTATIPDAASSVVITHGLRAAPRSVVVTPRGNEHVWVSARTATSFTVSRSGTAGALNVDWQSLI